MFLFKYLFSTRKWNQQFAVYIERSVVSSKFFDFVYTDLVYCIHAALDSDFGFVYMALPDTTRRCAARRYLS